MALPIPNPLGYSYLSFGQAVSTLAARLQDPTGIYWNQAPLYNTLGGELNGLIVEALRVWQAYTSWYRDTAALTLQPNVLFYDLPNSTLTPSPFAPVNPVYSTNPLGYNVTNQQVYADVIYALLGLGFDQFTQSAVQIAIQTRVNRFLGDTGCVLSHIIQGVDGPPASQFALGDGVIDVRRTSWLDATTGLYTYLSREDEWAMNHFGAFNQVSPTPLYYSSAVTPPMSVQVAPAPTNTGALDLLVVQNSVITPFADTALIGVPDDLSWAIKYGAMADILGQDGQGRDPARAAYCEKRYAEAVQIARTFPSVLLCSVGGVDLQVESVYDLDNFANSWPNSTPGLFPAYVGSAGRNLFAASPVTGLVTVSLNVVRNMPIPYAAGDFLQVPRDVADIILDEAQHAASFKMAGEEFMATERMHQNLMLAAAEYNSRLREMAFFNDAIRQPATRQQLEVPAIGKM